MQGEWIWLAESTENIDVYGEFLDAFVWEDGTAELTITADSQYAAYVNGKLAAWGQYPDFPWYKVYDTVDLTPFCRRGANRLAITVWHHGEAHMSCFPGNAALRYCVSVGAGRGCASGAGTLSRQSRAYRSGYRKILTAQLGFSFLYDMNEEDGWITKDVPGFAPCRVVEQDLPLFPRPTERCILGEARETEILIGEPCHALIDLGQEDVGFLTLRMRSDTAQRVTVAYGEHILDGGVRRRIGGRDFSVEIILRPGENVYTHPFRRLGCRYLELFAEAPVEVERLTLLPVSYPVTDAGKRPDSPLRREIYDMSVRTLRLCMHDHYEDTPWREQALYAMDSRNQMLCGYYAFGEYRFPRANLLLMAQDDRADGLLSICTPTCIDLTIPSFSLHWFVELEEYWNYSGDAGLIREVWEKMRRVIGVFIARWQEAELPIFGGAEHWNFYEWAEGLDGILGRAEDGRYDAALHCLFSRALQCMDRMAAALGLPWDHAGLWRDVNRAVVLRFRCGDGVFRNDTVSDRRSCLVNALAILCGAAGEGAPALAEKLAAGSDLTPATLSMVGFVYDALLLTDRDRYCDRVLDDIDTKYGKMLRAGAASCWETELGAADFENAGSLSHGWSAMPVYYYSILLPECGGAGQCDAHGMRGVAK